MLRGGRKNSAGQIYRLGHRLFGQRARYCGGQRIPGFGVLQFYKLKDSHEGHLKDIENVVGDEIKNIKM